MSPPPQIVHLGLGAFHRAHQAVYTADAEGPRWPIIGVSLRSTGVVQALNAQGGRYTLVTQAPTGPQYRMIDVHGPALSGAEGLEPIRAVLAAPQTRLITLTVTEKGYTQDDLPELLVSALADRLATGAPGVTLMSCDNLVDNGRVLRGRVQDAAARHGPALTQWIDNNASFPSTMVDRITPATPPSLAEAVRKATGFADTIPVQTEPFSQWVIEDRFAGPRPRWETAGALLVADVRPFETMKLRMLNGAHSLLAYLGHVSGKGFVRDVMADPDLGAMVPWYMTAAAATLTPGDGLDPPRYQSDLIERFKNPSIAHETYQIAMDGSQKLPHRVFSAALVAADRGQDLTPFAFATAAWARYTMGADESGAAYDLRDPRAAELSALPANADDRISALFALPDLVPERLAAQTAFRDQTCKSLSTMITGSIAEAARGILVP